MLHNRSRRPNIFTTIITHILIIPLIIVTILGITLGAISQTTKPARAKDLQGGQKKILPQERRGIYLHTYLALSSQKNATDI
jgi:uncharacterized alpha/beta hydrolase family protein